MDDLDELGVVAKKENRRKKLTPKTHSTEVSVFPVSGEHELSRQEREKLEKKKLMELIKK